MNKLDLFSQIKAEDLKSGISIVYLINEQIVNDYVDEVGKEDEKIYVWVNDYSRKIYYERDSLVRVDGCVKVN